MCSSASSAWNCLRSAVSGRKGTALRASARQKAKPNRSANLRAGRSCQPKRRGGFSNLTGALAGGFSHGSASKISVRGGRGFAEGQRGDYPGRPRNRKRRGGERIGRPRRTV